MEQREQEGAGRGEGGSREGAGGSRREQGGAGGSREGAGRGEGVKTNLMGLGVVADSMSDSQMIS